MLSAPITVKTADWRPKSVGRVVPLHFSESAEVPETHLHLDLRTLLCQLLHLDDMEGNAVASLVPGLHWVLAPAGNLPRVLRIASQVEPLVLVQTDAEARESERQAKDVEPVTRDLAGARVRELEELLRSSS